MEELKNEELNKIINNLHNDKVNSITLRRAFSKPVASLNIKEQFAFLEVTNETAKFSNLSSKNWFIVTLLAKQLDFDKSIRMEDYLHELYQSDETTESLKRKISKLLEKKDSKRLFRELSWFVKYANTHGIRINEYILYKDLLNWKNSAYIWARKIVRKEGGK